MEMKPQEYPIVPEPTNEVGEALINMGFYLAAAVWFLGSSAVIMAWILASN
jgi:hypothetical protein